MTARDPNALTSLLDAQAVGFHYPQDGRGLPPFSLKVAAGEGILVSGPSGCGKTTLLRSLAGLQRFSGTVWIKTSSGVQAPDLGIVFQNPDLQLFNPNVRESWQLSWAQLVTWQNST